MSKLCYDYTNETLDRNYFHAHLKNASEYKIDLSTVNRSIPLSAPTLPNMTFAEGYKDTYLAFYENFDNSTYFGAGLLIYFGVVMLLGAIFNFLTKVGVIQKFVHPIINKSRSHVTIPTMFPKGRNARPMGGLKIFEGLFPDRLDSLICLGYTIVHIVFWAYPYHASAAHSYLWASKTAEIRRMVSDRTGIIAFAEVPLLILFAGRNNFLAFCTGFKYSSFIHFHKLVSRFMVIDAIIHSVGYTLIVKARYTTSIKSLYFACGVAATTIAGCIWLFSFYPIRSRQYEIFLYSHIIMAIGFIAMCWYHCRNLGYCEWIVAACTIWVFDRLIRIVRMAFFGWPQAQICLISQDTFKVELERPKSYVTKPGQYAFVYFADPWLWFQNHPLTVYVEGNKLVLYVKVKKGITNKIYKKLIAAGGKYTCGVCLEGPYGESAPVHKYSNALLITGGSGVPGIVNYALTLSKQSKPQNIKFIWVHKTIKDLNFYFEDLLSKFKGTRVIVDIYITRESSLSGAYLGSSTSGSSDEGSVKDDVAKTKERTALPSYINFKLGRPDWEKMLSDEVESFGGGSVGIVACGPPMMMDQLKHYVSKEVCSSDKRIDYFDEYQIW
ncbi:unnamed protein product [Ambrosiozyma monospora]|uniref:Unnamed protein product n=1 Tax=Ambrosiozyma monospora TaxID=43982 RepID=A0ACB5SVJ1_AMBMO|nr:unnamed protein product [Ambrosiozyma monospora]